MYLKRLELCGFKSFADKTKLDFEPGISAIIGPNGCGKSNISDSMRWCLGEQSAKSMRSKQMLDVIFGGSQSRPTTGMAEVTLTFDNASNVLPLDYSEVSITRRLFRSGESEYFINRIQCRLKDIRDLFLDTGIGSEGYSIIEQGKVEFLLLATAEERREMFEEAAGVSKYKVRREETLRKLEKVDVDMNRVNDMLALLKDQITALDIAAKKARQYQKHRDDLKRLEITALVHGIARDMKEIERVRTELEPQILSFESLNTALNQTEAALADLRVKQVQKDDEYVKMQDEFSQVKSGINLSDERIAQAAVREQELGQRHRILEDEVRGGEQRVAQFEQELAQVQTLAGALAGRVQELELEYRKREEETLRIRAAILDILSRETTAKESLVSFAAQKSAVHNDQNRLQSLQSYCQAQIASLTRDLDRQTEHLTPVGEEITAKEAEHNASLAHLGDLRTALQRIQSSITDAEQRLAASRERQRALNTALIAAESREHMIREWEQKDPHRTTLRAVMSADLPGLRGPVSSLVRIDPGMDEVVAAALGDKLNFLVAESIEAAQRAIKFLEETASGRLTFVVLDRVPETAPAGSLGLPPAARTLESMLQCSPEYTPLVRFLCQSAVVNGTQIYGTALLQGGSKIAFDQPVLIEEQLRQIAGDIDDHRRNLLHETEAAGTLEQELTSLRSEYRTTEMDCQKVELHNGWMEKQLSAKREELELLNKGITLNRTDIAAKQSEEQQVIAQMADAEHLLVDLSTREDGARTELAAIETELQQCRTRENEEAPLLTEAKVAWATQSNELASRQREEQKLTEVIGETRRQMEQYRQELNAIDARVIELAEVRETETARLQELHAIQRDMERTVQATLVERQSLMDELERKNAAITDSRQQVESLKQAIHDRQMDQRSFELTLQTNQQRLSEEHGVSYEDVKAEYMPLSVSDEEIARLKRRIDSMGAVNLAAPEEYTALEERYNFLLTQQQDLLKAKEDLLQVISKINQTTREHFRLTFDKVRENFRTLYHQLFEGGEADLILTDESNLLETGVEIMAQPPGKKLQNITLLSGGEKALTAIALLFAFFMVRPSPFCILDEVDAPLDDANIGRYINMIKAFAERSQFLVVTHNKRTMEMADVLYGVTMEELGVSKIISVKLNKQNELAAV